MNEASPGASRVDPAAAGAPLIELRDITKTYVRGDVATEVLHGISLDIHPGEFVAIMGASGSGKSTLMNLIGLLDRPTSGSYRFDGEEVSSLDADRRALLRREAFGFIFQQYNLLASATATENVEVPAIYAGVPHGARVQRAQEILITLGLGERLNHRPSQLSGGQQQRVSIARALMNGGAVILADEPTGALDSKSGEEVMRLLHDLNAAGHTVLLITHDPAVAAQARRVIEIKDGHIVTDRGTTAPPPGAAAALQRRTTHRASAIPDTIEAGKMALRALRANLMRTLLTLLGIIIGVASVVAMLAIGDGAKQQVLSRITAMGTNLLLIRPGAPNVRMAGALTATLVPADADAIDDLPNVAVAVPEYPGQVTVRYQSRDYVTQADGTSQFFPQARDWPVASGTFFSDTDVKSYTPVIVLGQTVVRALYVDGTDPVGTFVLVNNVPFQVIGVMSAKGASPYGADQDDIVFTPITTGALRLFGQRYVRSITVQVEDVSRIDETQEAIRQLLIARHKSEDFQIRNMASILEAATETQNTLTILLGSIAAISLLVGGIGVMNIMLVSVTERTREIGIRMATGARRFNILLQFNTEALVVCAIGGLIGVVAGPGAAWAFAQLGRPVMFSAGPVILAFACAFATGLLFGYLPARKAANLDPVVALAAD
ncbi:MacB family efflux pump subunit [Vineibacter terrae]|uniref:MacB family efflux pump subunit n=1 Tax=Vineibacter terrae TaxID=2586908 RepID=UPI002E2EECFC|nr:MacB family efflux pump subunit [Vineibacter terrae]HEX2890377.1 MacB family efflux pump subunit [Vineibacter terrae]